MRRTAIRSYPTLNTLPQSIFPERHANMGFDLGKVAYPTKSRAVRILENVAALSVIQLRTTSHSNAPEFQQPETLRFPSRGSI